MGFEKAKIIAIRDNNKEDAPIDVMFNPTDYTVTTTSSYEKKTVPNAAGASMEMFTGKESQKLSLGRLFFDSYEEKISVRTYTDKLQALMSTKDSKKPPLIKFVWGKWSFTGVMSSMTVKYTMFLDSGIPVRAEISNLTINSSDKPGEINNEQGSAASGVQKNTDPNQPLYLVAYEEFGDSELWKKLAKKNNVSNPRRLKAGTQLVVTPEVK